MGLEENIKTVVQIGETVTTRVVIQRLKANGLSGNVTNYDHNATVTEVYRKLLMLSKYGIFKKLDVNSDRKREFIRVI